MGKQSLFGIWGIVIAVAGFGWLVLMFWHFHESGVYGNDVFDNLSQFGKWITNGWNPSPGVGFLCGVWEAHLGTFLCVKGT